MKTYHDKDGKFIPSVMYPDFLRQTLNEYVPNKTVLALGTSSGIEADIVEELKKMIPEGMTLAQMSLRWILDFAAVTVVIPGSKSPLQIPDNASATHLPSLPKSLHDKLSSFYNEEIAQHIRGKY